MKKSDINCQDRSILAKRKKLRKRHPGSEWIGGVLYSEGDRVSRVPNLPKKGREAVGKEANPKAVSRQTTPSYSFSAILNNFPRWQGKF